VPNSRLFFAALSVAALMGTGTFSAPAEPAPAPTPKLIVAIAVDQFSGNLFDEWRGRFTGGFKRLAGGVVYPAGYQTHAATETCPGHSTLLTGKHPAKTGIIANTFRDPELNRMVYCLNDPGVVLAHDPKAQPVSPKRLMASTLGEWLKAASPQSRVIAVAGKDRAAINMAGHNADGAFWLIEGYGFTTYMAPGADAAKALAPVAGYNASIAKVWKTRPKWTYAHSDCRASAATWNFGGKAWESKLPPAGWGESDAPATIKTSVMNSPMADEITGDAARYLVKTLKLGQGSATDLLAVSFSATDFIGHRYGSRGPEMCEEMHRLDETLGRLFADLDKLHVPYLVVLTADHGGSDFAERLQAQGYPMAKRINSGEVMGRVNQALMAEFNLAKPPLQGNVEESNIVGVPEADKARVAEAAVRVLTAQPEVAAAFTQTELLAATVRKGVPPDELTLKERFAESIYPGRSPDVLAALQPQFTLTPAIPGTLLAGHGTAWNYDRRVPMLFWWPGAVSETRFLPVETVDIAPTLAGALKLTPPADVDGRCLKLPASSGVTCPR
jgi:predicted AlkP superfamily pyrophosphatase or phosphodiesterase